MATSKAAEGTARQCQTRRKPRGVISQWEGEMNDGILSITSDCLRVHYVFSSVSYAAIASLRQIISQSASYI